MAVAVVTGVSGYLGGHVVKNLVEKGYTVRGTVRSLNDASKIDEIKKLFPTLKLYEADLLKVGSFDEVIAGADYVFHTASPFPVLGITFADPYKEVVEPAVEGTRNVLESVSKAPSVKRVIVTSSMAAMAGIRPVGHIFTEFDWNLDSTLTGETYRYSKRVAEEAAWNIAKEKKLDLVVMNPSFILGPILTSRSDATSIKAVKSFLDGSTVESGVKAYAYGCVDVRDVAEAHVRAAEVKEANGRYILSTTDAISQLELVELLRKSSKFDTYPLPTKEAEPVKTRLKYSNTKAQTELGLHFTAISQTIVDMAVSLINLGVVPKK